MLHLEKVCKLYFCVFTLRYIPNNRINRANAISKPTLGGQAG